MSALWWPGYRGDHALDELSQRMCGHMIYICDTIYSQVLVNCLVVFPITLTYPQRAYKEFFLECSVNFKVDGMPYSIPPKFKPSGSTKVIRFSNTISLWTSLYTRGEAHPHCGGFFLRWWRRWCGTNRTVCSLSRCGSSSWPCSQGCCYFPCLYISYIR